MTIFIVSSLTAIIISFICSLSEAALLSLNKIKVETDKSKGLSYAVVTDKMLNNISRPISAILILNTIAHTGGATIAGSAFDDLYGEKWIWLFSVTFTVVILFGTEILPKILGVSFANSLMPFLARPLNLTIKLLYPIVWMTELFSRLILKKKQKAQYSIEDIQTIAHLSQAQDVIDIDQKNIIINTSTLNERPVSEIMLPISQLIFIPQSATVDECFELAETHLHTRFPVSRTSSPDDIFGYINFKEVALKYEVIKDKGLADLIRPIAIFDEQTSILKALQELNRKKQHISLVRNESMQYIGMVTLEDAIEDVIGEIYDEFDSEAGTTIK